MSQVTLQSVSWVICWLPLVSGLTFVGLPVRNGRLLGSEFSKTNTKNFRQCLNLCSQQAACESVNYNMVTRECTSNSELLTGDTGNGFEIHPETLYSGKPPGNYVCSKDRCEKTQVCAKLGSMLKCLEQDIDCGPPPQVPNASLNNTGTSYTSTATYFCYPGFSHVSGTTTSTCTSSGTWTTASFHCAVDCGQMDVKNGSFISLTTTVGSRGEVKCDALFRFVGKNSSAECKSSGLWEGLSGECRQEEWRNESTRFLAMLPEPITNGWEMILRGTAGSERKHFRVDIVGSDDVYLMVDFRLSTNSPYIAFDCRYSGRFESRNIFIRPPRVEIEVPFELRITQKNNFFTIIVNGTEVYVFNSTRPVKGADSITVYFEVAIHMLKIL